VITAEWSRKEMKRLDDDREVFRNEGNDRVGGPVFRLALEPSSPLAFSIERMTAGASYAPQATMGDARGLGIAMKPHVIVFRP